MRRGTPPPWRPALLAGLLAALAGGCFLYTAPPERMRAMVNKYFNPEAGVYPSLDDPIFAVRNRFTGIMDAEGFAEEFGFWIFLTGPHDPAKIPVLMVHGHWTGPPAFKALAASLDRERFEPWFTFYPTGGDLRASATQLRQNLERLCAYYHQDTVLVIGFSMGGLVARQALRPAEDNVKMPRVPLFIGIANPWGGSLKVRTGARLAFAADSWRQFVDGSQFMADLFRDPLPRETRFHMIYGVGGDDAFLPGRDDGILSERSLGRAEAVAEAASVTILPGSTHSSVISDPETLCKVNELLASFLAGRRGVSGQAPAAGNLSPFATTRILATPREDM